jgi:hypothetical protein
MYSQARMKMCNDRSLEGFSCQLETGHTGPCSRVLWRDNGAHKRVYWWTGQPASETLDFVRGPK